MLGSVLGIVVAPIITSAYSLSEQGGAEFAPPWEPTLSESLGFLFSFASPEAVYATYGKLCFLVFLGFLLGLVGLYNRRSGHTGRLEKWGFRLSFVGLALNLLGNLGDYSYQGGLVESTPDFLGFLLAFSDSKTSRVCRRCGSVLLGWCWGIFSGFAEVIRLNKLRGQRKELCPWYEAGRLIGYCIAACTFPERRASCKVSSEAGGRAASSGDTRGDISKVNLDADPQSQEKTLLRYPLIQWSVPTLPRIQTSYANGPENKTAG